MNKKIWLVIFLGLIFVITVSASFVSRVFYDLKTDISYDDNLHNSNVESKLYKHDSFVEINGVSYSEEDFNSYKKLWLYESNNEEDLATLFENYTIYKLYYQYVEKYKMSLSSGDVMPTLTEDEKLKLEEYELSEEEYKRVKTEIFLVDKLYNNLEKYYDVSDDLYNEYKLGNEEKFKTYYYRVMLFDISDSKESAKQKAQIALNKVKAGESFEAVAKKYGNSRIAYSLDSGGYNIVNGILETVSGLYMENYIWDEEILNALKFLKKGNYSEIYEGDSSYGFVYLEDVCEGLDEESNKLYLKQIASEEIQTNALIVDNRNKDKFNTYKFRIIQIRVDTNSNLSNLEREVNINNARIKINEAFKSLEKGLDFKKVAEKYSDELNTYQYLKDDYVTGKGNLLTSSGVYMSKFFLPDEISDIVMSLKPQEYEVCKFNYGDNVGMFYYIVYLEEIQNGLTEDEENFYRSEVNTNK